MFPPKLVHILMGVLALTLVACAATNDEIPLTGGDGAETSLANTSWSLVSFGQPGAETPVAKGIVVTLQLEDSNQAGGSGGCNTFGAMYEVSNGNMLSFTEIVSTVVACNDEALMEQETQYFEALRSADSFEIAGDTLTIRYAHGVLTFSRIAPGIPDSVYL